MLVRLELRGFRNYQELSLSLHPRQNVFFGGNGQGKTNILEAIYFLGAYQGFRTNRREDLIMWGMDQAELSAYFSDESFDCLKFIFAKGKKYALLNGKEIKEAAKFCHISVVKFDPQDENALSGHPVERRNLLDRAILAIDPTYRETLKKFSRALLHRNHLLKRRTRESLLLETWTEHFVDAALPIQEKRCAFLEEINSQLTHYMQSISSKEDTLSLCYVGNVANTEKRLQDREALRDCLLKLLPKEREVGFSLAGPHRESVAFLVNGKDSRRFSSRGQLKSALLSFKLAELSLLRKYGAKCPLFVVDDVTSELDERRQSSFFELCESLKAQVFISSPNRRGRGDDLYQFIVYNGRIKKIDGTEEGD